MFLYFSIWKDRIKLGWQLDQEGPLLELLNRPFFKGLWPWRGRRETECGANAVFQSFAVDWFSCIYLWGRICTKLAQDILFTIYSS